MGVYINMEMPRNCNECRFAIENYCYAVVKYKHLRGGERANWCPLIEVPPHGRLIDADALVSVIAILQDKTDNAVVWEQMRYIADDMQTVIPAEREEDNA